jgi:hypothetical protein
MMSKTQVQSSFLAIIVLALGACSTSQGSSILDESGDQDAGVASDDDPASASRKHPVDAAVPPPSDAQTAPDAGGGGTGGGGGSGGNPSSPGVVSCYLEGYPGSTCAQPSHCCFSNYSAQHDGECSTSACSWGTIDCDGPEDCASGQHCCAHAIVDPDYGLTGYKLGCQASACGAAPINQELCHPTSSAAPTCSNGRTCVPALGNDNDLPRTLSICK